ncbi:glycerate kinase [Lapidilactobacillus luobeiensis]|uniref:glycerate kinase n=1 Tax=Lapidilactobacillus luobeiensis TaxID=2950371 RepID=UPI0021C431DC|nr:glycerate kinase [Lapidilactobacillus luobeiensis]
MRILMANQALTADISGADSGQAIQEVLQAEQQDLEIVSLPFNGELGQIIAGMQQWREGRLADFTFYGPTWASTQTTYLVTTLQNRRTALIDTTSFSNPQLSQTYDNHDLFHASSYGLGQLILDAVTNEAQEIVLILGETGMIDGGLGLLQALGAVITDESGDPIPVGENPLINFGAIDLAKTIELLQPVHLTILTQEQTIYTGHESGIVRAGKKLGLQSEQVVRLDVRAGAFNRMLRNLFDIDLTQIVGAGAGGGIAGALACLGATIESDPFAWLLQTLELRKMIAGFDTALLTTGAVNATFKDSLIAHLAEMCATMKVPTILQTLSRSLPLSATPWSTVSIIVLPSLTGLQVPHSFDEVNPGRAELLQSLSVSTRELLKLLQE